MQDIDSYTTPTKRVTRFEPSKRFSERKRALFPSQNNDSDSDLGHISPLDVSSSPDRFENFILQKSFDIEDKYFTLTDNDNEENIHSEKESSKENRSPNKRTDNGKSPNSDIFVPNTPTPTTSPERDSDSGFVPETPIKDSPTRVLKTPHDTSNSNLELPRLVRKSLVDISNIDKSNLKRKSDSPIDLTEPKNVKLDNSFNKVSKARTALFTDNIFPAKSFYPKTENSKQEMNLRYEAPSKKKMFLRKTTPVYLCNRRKGTNRKHSGQINAGVRHGIKKPKHKLTLTKTQLLKAAMQIVKNSPLNEYLNSQEESKKENECGVSVEQLQKMDSILKNIHSSSINAKPLTILTEIKPISQNITVNNEIIEQKEKILSAKRPLSPQPDVKKKFFKSAPSVATVTINNIKLKVDHGEFSLIEKEQKEKKKKFEDIEFDATDLTSSEEKIINQSFTDILKSLEDDNICDNIVPNPVAFALKTNEDFNFSNNFTLTAHTSVTASENSILLHNEPVNNYSDQNFVSGEINQITYPTETSFQTNQQSNNILTSNINNQMTNDMLLSPTSLVCDLTSGLALNSPKSQTEQNIDLNKLNASKKRICFTETMSDEKKLFPIFSGKQNTHIPPKNHQKESRHIKNIKKIWKPISDDQTLLDAGQKKFGVTQCPECKVVYSVGEPEDEIMHYNHHNAVGVLRYNGWKHERVVNQTHKGKVIQIKPDDPKSWWRKVKELLVVVNDDLGFVDVPFDATNKKVFLYIENKQIVGCLVAEPKQQAYKMLPSGGDIDQCSEESYPVMCGISRLWVAVTHRKQGVATCLMNAMRAQFIYGHILSMSEIAFSSPTESGKLFAQKYTNTNSYLIYTS